MTAMPSPVRTVTRSVSVLQRAGLDRRQACELVIEVCTTVLRKLESNWAADLDWVHDVRAAAKRMIDGENP